MSLVNDTQNELLFVGFNQDQGCFACGTDNGFRIYNVDPFRETFRRQFSNGGIGIVEMLFRCNLLALVGGGSNPRYPPNKVMVWDDHQNRCIGELSFKSEVKAVKLRRDKVVVVLLKKIYVYRFSDLKLLDQIPTIENPKGLVALCPDSSNTVLACPNVHQGHIRVELYDIRKSNVIPAHEAELACIALNGDGTRVASASYKGTLIRVFDTHTGNLLQELRRGMDRAEIYSICFNPTTTFLACSSDKGTVHIFSLGPTAPGARPVAEGSASAAAATTSGQRRQTSQDAAPQNTKSGLAFVKSMLPGIVPKYFGSEWSYAQVRGLEGKCICAFGSDPSTIVVVCADGTFLMSSFEEGGECTRISYARFIRAEGEEEDAMTAAAPLGAGLSPSASAASADRGESKVATDAEKAPAVEDSREAPAAEADGVAPDEA